MSGRKCTVCAHPKREAIEAALIDGGSNRVVAGQYRAGRNAIDRHRREHMPVTIIEAAKMRDARMGDAGAERLADTHRRLEIIIKRNMRAREDKMALMALKIRLDAMAYERPPVQRVELSEAVRKLTPEQVADELAAAVLELAATEAPLRERFRVALFSLLS